MHSQGRYLRFRHVMPEIFGPGVQARRGLLRLRWFLLQRIDFRPIWTVGAAAGLGGVLLTVSLFFLQGNLRPVIAAREPVVTAPVLTMPQQPPVTFTPPPVPIYTPPPVETPKTSPYLSPELSRLVMPFGWEDRRLSTVASIPQPMEPTLPFNFSRNDLWARASFRAFPTNFRQTFVPYREPAGLRWNSVTPEVRYSSFAGRSDGISTVTRPMAIVEKQMPTTYAGEGPLEYRLIVTNPSRSPLPDVSVFEAVDVTRVTAADPPARVEPTGLSWKLNGLAPGERRELTVSIWTDGLTQLAAATDVELADRVSAIVQVEGQTESPFFEREPTPAVSPAIDVPAFPRATDLPPFPALNSTREPTPPPAPVVPSFPTLPAAPAPTPPQGRPLLKLTTEPPQAVAVGEDATTWYEIENIGDAAAVDIVLRLQLANGLLHHDGSHDVEFSISKLEPGEKRRARLVTRAESHGLFDVSGQLTSGDQAEATSIQLLAPERESVAGETEPETNSRTSPKNCKCTLLVRRTSTGRR